MKIVLFYIRDYISVLFYFYIYRRGRAMKRLMKQLDGLSGETCDKLLLPLVRTYIYNEDYDAQTIVVTAAIDCVGALAAKLCWKKYAKLLQQFLSQKPLELRYQKQRVKVLASVLDGFDFSDEGEWEFSDENIS